MNLWMALRGKEKVTGKHLLIIGALLVFLLISTAWTVAYTSTSEFCGSTCHEMSPMYQSWQMSAHKNVSCDACHVEPGVKGLVKAKANGLKEVYVHVTSSNINPKASKDDFNCYSCHQDKVKVNTSKALAAKDPHTIKHFDNGMTCVTCHGGLVHDAKRNNAVPRRDNCTTCHLDAMNK